MSWLKPACLALSLAVLPAVAWGQFPSPLSDGHPLPAAELNALLSWTLVNVKNPTFAGGATLDGGVDDLAAFNAARAAAGNAAVFVPPGGWNVSATPTGGGANPVLWQLSGNRIGTGTTPVIGIGTDTVETFFSGNKYIGRTATVADMQPVLWINQTITHSGGTVGFVTPTLKVLTNIPANASALNDFVWGIQGVMHVSSTGPAQNVGLSSTVFKDGGSSPVFAFNPNLTDTTGRSSSNGGGFVNTEVDAVFDGVDDGCCGFRNVPNGQGIRVIQDVTASRFGAAGAPAQARIGWGVRLSSPDTTSAVIERGFSVLTGIGRAAFSTEYAVFDPGADAFRMAQGQTFALGGSVNHTLSYDPGGFMAYNVAGATVFRVLDNGHVGLNVSPSPNISLAIGGSGAVGLDTVNATLSGAAIRIGAGQKISLEPTDSRQLYYNAGTGKIYYSVAGVNVWSVDNAGNIRAAGTFTPSVTP
jgi:hypothetical protein